MAERKGLDHTAYGGIRGDEYVPFIPASEAMPETTVVSLVMGALFAILFAAANTYLGLKVGMTISAGIPAAILATGILKIFFRRNNILEANLIQGIAAMGESIAGGIIFTLPAIIIWGLQLQLSTIVIATLLGGLLGIFFVVPLRRYLVVEEHGQLIFPESMAAAEILVTGSEGGTGSIKVHRFYRRRRDDCRDYGRCYSLYCDCCSRWCSSKLALWIYSYSSKQDEA